jgi:DNA-binding transcriptional regulator PaaX
MRAKTELLLYRLSRVGEMMIRPSLRRWIRRSNPGRMATPVEADPTAGGAGMIEDLRGIKVDGGSLTLMEGTPVAGETPADLVSSAWDFERIHRSWLELSNHLDLGKKPSGELSDKILVEWLAHERRLVSRCLTLDPLLPVGLLPEGYPGRKVWKKRGDVLAKLTMGPG